MSAQPLGHLAGSLRLVATVLLLLAGACAPASSPAPTPVSPLPQAAASPSRPLVPSPSPSPALLLAAPSPSPSAAAEEPLSLGVVNSAPMGSNDLPILAKDLGIDSQYGLQAQVTQAATPALVQGLLGGSFDVVLASGETVVSANLAGADLVMIGQVSRTLSTELVASPSITDPSQLKGTVGCTLSPAGANYVSMRHYVESQGLNPDTDVTFLATGSSQNDEAALEADRCQFTEAAVDTAAPLVADGYHVLFDFRTTPYPQAAFVTKRSTIQANRALVLRFLEATTAAIAYVKSHPQETMADLVSRGVPNDAQLPQTYQAGADSYALPPVLDREGLQNMMDWNSEVTPAFKGVSVDSQIDTSLMDELQTSGFLQSLGIQSQGSP